MLREQALDDKQGVQDAQDVQVESEAEGEGEVESDGRDVESMPREGNGREKESFRRLR